MTDEDRDRIVAEAHATLERLQEREQVSPRHMPIGGHFDPVRARRIREPEPEEAEVRYTEPLRSDPAPAIEQPPVLAEDFISELIAHVLAETTAEYDRKVDALREEIAEVRRVALTGFADQLKHAVDRVDELVGKLTKVDRMREPERGTVIDMPSPLPSRNRTGMN